jgi:hypothetical protein
LLLLTLCLGLYYGLVYRPLSRRVADLEPPLTRIWRDLAQAVPTLAASDLHNPDRIQADLEAAQAANRLIQQLALMVGARIEPDAVTRARMTEPFQLIEFQNDRQTRLEELSQLAKASNTVLNPPVSQGFPEYLAEQAYPELLWPQLQMCHFLVGGAIRSGVSTVAVVRLQPVQFHRSASDHGEWLVELPAEIEASGAAPSITRFLERLPLRSAEIKDRGLPETAPAKPVIFVRGLVIRKEGRESPDWVRMELTASCFVRFVRAEPRVNE